MTKGHLRNTYMTKWNYCLYPWRQYIAFRMYIGFTFDKILCISTTLRICIRNVCILKRIQNQIFGDSESFSSKGIYGPHTWQKKNDACILIRYFVLMTYIGCIFDQICCISTKLRICIRYVRILERIKIWYLGILDLFAQCSMEAGCHVYMVTTIS